MASSILARLAVLISANTAELQKGLKQSEQALGTFSKSLKGIAASVGIAFAAKEVAGFAFEVAKLSGEAEGVRAAFNRLPEAEQLLGRLKDATAGTVSELDLMKRTVQAANFGIELEALPELLKFAAIRAQQTGESVDYLVNSIITGIGRKSPLILDNLGISAVRLKEQFNGAALEAQSIGDVAKAVGRIAGEELTKMGDFAETTSTKVQRLDASWQNFKVTIGDVINRSGVLQNSLDFVTDLLGGSSNPEAALANGLRLLNESGISGERYAEALKVVQKQANAVGVTLISLTDTLTGVTKVMIDPRSKIKVITPQEGIEQVQTLEALKAKLKELNQEFETIDAADKKRLETKGSEIIAINKQIEALERLRKEQELSGQLQTAFAKQQLENITKALSGEIVKDQPIIPFKAGIDTSSLEALPTTEPLVLANNLKFATDAVLGLRDAFGQTGPQNVDSINQQITAQELQAESYDRLTNKALAFGDAIGSALSQAISGQVSFVQALKNVTKEILTLFLKQALGAAIAGSLKTAKNPFIGIALAAAAVAAVSGLFSKATGTSGSGGASLSKNATTNVQRSGTVQQPTESIVFNAKFRIEGNDLVAAVNSTNNKNGRLGG